MRIWLVLAFIVVPIIELAVLIQVGEVVGLGPTLLLVVLVSMVGAWLVRREGARAWRRFREALQRARVPTTEVVDGALVLFAGALLLTPGFVTDVLGLLLLAPPTRAIASGALRHRAGRSLLVGVVGGTSNRTAPKSPPTRGDVVDAEVLDMRRRDHDG